MWGINKNDGTCVLMSDEHGALVPPGLMGRGGGADGYVGS